MKAHALLIDRALRSVAVVDRHHCSAADADAPPRLRRLRGSSSPAGAAHEAGAIDRAAADHRRPVRPALDGRPG
jgi:hypothetical protein